MAISSRLETSAFGLRIAFCMYSSGVSQDFTTSRSRLAVALFGVPYRRPPVFLPTAIYSVLLSVYFRWEGVR